VTFGSRDTATNVMRWNCKFLILFFLRKLQNFARVISIEIRGGEILGVNFGSESEKSEQIQNLLIRVHLKDQKNFVHFFCKKTRQK
jgi:hypothetical protein